MAPLCQALEVDDHRCELDPSWSIGAIPQGGTTRLIAWFHSPNIPQATPWASSFRLVSCTNRSSHADPIHVSAHFLRPTSAGTGQVHVKLLKSGRTFTNIVAELVQQETVRITAHLLFGNLSPTQSDQVQKVLAPPSPYARRLPLYSHPSTVSSDATKPPWARKMEIRMSVDAVCLSRNDPNSPVERTTTDSVGGGGVEWGAWCELSHKDDKLTTSSIPFFCDLFVNLPDLLPQSEPGSTAGKKSRFLTITMTVEFKARIPSSDNYSTRTVGVYSESRFRNYPQGRHNVRVEVWTAPSQIGQGDTTKGWRDRQYCIAVADQVALMLPVEPNTRQRAKNSVKL